MMVVQTRKHGTTILNVKQLPQKGLILYTNIGLNIILLSDMARGQ